MDCCLYNISLQLLESNCWHLRIKFNRLVSAFAISRLICADQGNVLLLDVYDDQPPILFRHLGKGQGDLGGYVVSILLYAHFFK